MPSCWVYHCVSYWVSCWVIGMLTGRLRALHTTAKVSITSQNNEIDISRMCCSCGMGIYMMYILY